VVDIDRLIAANYAGVKGSHPRPLVAHVRSVRYQLTAGLLERC
jgi:hypothetical protein